MKHYNKMARQSGMTLIELTVVLLVLVGLAGLMMPYVGSFVGKTHDATGSQNAVRLGEAIQRYQTTRDTYPSNLDPLLVGAVAGASATIIDYTMLEKMRLDAGDAAAVAHTTMETNYGWSPLDLATNASVCGSLMKAGLGDSVTNMVNTKTGFNATFSNADATTLTVPQGTTSGMGVHTCLGGAVEMSAAKVADAFGITTDTTKTYIVYGVGQANSAIGKTLQEAPVHFAKNADFNASKAYNRFVSVFAADNSAADAASAGAATYVATGMAMMTIVGVQKELGNYYADAAANN